MQHAPSGILFGCLRSHVCHQRHLLRTSYRQSLKTKPCNKKLNTEDGGVKAIKIAFVQLPLAKCKRAKLQPNDCHLLKAPSLEIYTSLSNSFKHTRPCTQYCSSTRGDVSPSLLICAHIRFDHRQHTRCQTNRVFSYQEFIMPKLTCKQACTIEANKFG